MKADKKRQLNQNNKTQLEDKKAEIDTRTISEPQKTTQKPAIIP
jgi:hypothetical protein